MSRRGGEAAVSVLILAAGLSSRMGERNKLLAAWRGKALVRHVAEQALASQANAVYVVTGHEGDRVADALADLPVTRAVNPEYRSGLASSLRAGLGALPASVGAVLVCLGDMPHVDTAALDGLIEAYSPDRGRLVCIPTFRGKRGNPVLLGRQLFPMLARLEGDAGARHIIAANSGSVAEVPVDTPGILLDVDTPEALEALSGNVYDRPTGR
ncbi:MAG: nucleotidyltransferase family protein [Ectothiorhodospiraceae bacterium]|nr:nucleotidyltransferase family protein [Ectothiorhodospiraceae bacterium]